MRSFGFGFGGDWGPAVVLGVTTHTCRPSWSTKRTKATPRWGTLWNGRAVGIANGGSDAEQAVSTLSHSDIVVSAVADGSVAVSDVSVAVSDGAGA